MKTFTAIISKEEDLYVAKCPEIGTTSQGSTIEEALIVWEFDFRNIY